MKRNLVYVRRILRIGAVLIILVGPIVVFLILNQGHHRYESLPTLGMVPLEEKVCEELYITKKPSLLFLIPHDTLIPIAQSFYRYLQERTHCDQDMTIFFFAKEGLRNDTAIHLAYRSLDYPQHCLTIERWDPFAFIIDSEGRIRSIHSYETAEKRRRFEEELRLFLFHLRTNGRYLEKKSQF